MHTVVQRDRGAAPKNPLVGDEADAGMADRLDGSDLAGVNRTGSRGVARLEPQYVPDEDRNTSHSGALVDGMRRLGRVRQGLLDRQRLAGIDRSQRRLDMEVLRGAHHDADDAGIGCRFERITDVLASPLIRRLLAGVLAYIAHAPQARAGV